VAVEKIADTKGAGDRHAPNGCHCKESSRLHLDSQDSVRPIVVDLSDGLPIRGVDRPCPPGPDGTVPRKLGAQGSRQGRIWRHLDEAGKVMVRDTLVTNRPGADPRSPTSRSGWSPPADPGETNRWTPRAMRFSIRPAATGAP
jgi:hypothetical protein